MATWKKVIVSGSAANLASLQVDNLLNGVVTGSANGTLGIVPINGTGSIVATTGATGVVMSGSFSGSFKGDGSNLSGVTATPTFPSTVKTNIASTDKFFINDDAGNATSGNKQITYSDLLVDLAGTNLVTESNDSLALATTITGITSISSTSFTGSLLGTASTASFVLASNVSGTVTSASYAVNATSASFATNAANATTASYILQAVSASFATTAANATTASYVLQAVSASFATSAANATSASFATTAATATSANQVANALTFGIGISGSAATYNGSTAVTFAVSGAAALSANNMPKWSGTGFVNSNVTDTGTQIQIGAGASGGVTVAAGGVNVTGNSTFNNNLTVSGDLIVNGTASFVNSTNLYVKDQFVLINSGSSTLTDAGIIAQYNTAGSGSAWYLEAASAGTYGRWAVAYDVVGTTTAVTADEYVVTTKISANSAPSAAPTWGGATNGSGNMWIKSDTGDIFIYA